MRPPHMAMSCAYISPSMIAFGHGTSVIGSVCSTGMTNRSAQPDVPIRSRLTKGADRMTKVSMRMR